MNYPMNQMAPSAQREAAPFVLPSHAGFDSDMMEDMDGAAPSFERFKIPGSGVTQFEAPSDDPENPNYVPKLEVVVLYTHNSNSYWPEDTERNDDTPPACQSADGKQGYGTPGGVCMTCPLNVYGSSSRGTGKACKNMKTLYVLRSGDMMPYVLSLPPTSIKAWQTFFNKTFTYRGRNVYTSLVEITIKRKNGNGYDYGVASFKLLRDFEGEELAAITQYAKNFREQARELLAQRNEMNRAMAAESIEMDDGTMQLPDNEGSFSFGEGIINGDVLGMPA